MEEQFSNIDKISFEIERAYINEGHKVIAGIDEAGRGALAGPLCVGLVIYNESFILNPDSEILNKIKDSKKLTPKKRIEALELVQKQSQYAIFTLVSHRIVDKLNINRATEYAIVKLLKRAPIKPDLLILDGNFRFNLGIPMRSIIKGDNKSISIASASIIAKVKRDKIIEKYDLIYPGYSFKNNKGYGASKHINAIKENGPSPIHRRSYEPTKSIVDDSVKLFDNEDSKK